MSLTAPLNAQSDFEFPDNGQYLAICHVIADMGIQHWEYQGQEKIGQKVHFGFELVKNYPRKGAPPSSATMKDGRPFGVSIQLPYSGHENSNMRKLLGTWRGEPFNDHELIGPEAPGYQLNSYLGGPALITIQKSTSTTGKTWANIVEITRALEPLVPEAFNPLVWFDFGNFNPAAFDMLPKWLQDRIKPTQDYILATQGPDAVTQRAMNQLKEAYPQADLTPKTKSLWADEEAGAVIIPDEPVPF